MSIGNGESRQDDIRPRLSTFGVQHLTVGGYGPPVHTASLRRGSSSRLMPVPVPVTPDMSTLPRYSQAGYHGSSVSNYQLPGKSLQHSDSLHLNQNGNLIMPEHSSHVHNNSSNFTNNYNQPVSISSSPTETYSVPHQHLHSLPNGMPHSACDYNERTQSSSDSSATLTPNESIGSNKTPYNVDTSSDHGFRNDVVENERDDDSPDHLEGLPTR